MARSHLQNKAKVRVAQLTSLLPRSKLKVEAKSPERTSSSNDVLELLVSHINMKPTTATFEEHENIVGECL